MKDKVFGIGLSRTGTVSLTAALKGLGYKAKHYPHLLKVIETAEAYDAVTDSPVVPYMETLARLYPRARFVLTVRDEEGWLVSCKAHYALKPIERIMAWKLWNRRATFGIETYDPEVFRRVYREHVARARAFFANERARLLELNICGGEGYERLCPFLGVPVLDEAFPHKNRG